MLTRAIKCDIRRQNNVHPPNVNHVCYTFYKNVAVIIIFPNDNFCLIKT